LSWRQSIGFPAVNVAITGSRSPSQPEQPGSLAESISNEDSDCQAGQIADRVHFKRWAEKIDVTRRESSPAPAARTCQIGCECLPGIVAEIATGHSLASTWQIARSGPASAMLPKRNQSLLSYRVPARA
jgi:hypothetical protein